MRLIDADALIDNLGSDDRDIYCKYIIEEAPTAERPSGVWKYHNDEHGIWWNCSKCGKILRRPPNDKRFCSCCGAEMTREA